MRLPGIPTLDELSARDALVVIRPHSVACRMIGHGVAIAALLLLGGWSIINVTIALKLLLVVLVCGAITMVAFSLRHLQRAGAFYFAADDEAVYFRRVEDLDLFAIPWARCLRIGGSATDGGRGLSLVFENADQPEWSALCHASVYRREETEVVISSLPDAVALRASLEGYREKSARRSPDGASSRHAA